MTASADVTASSGTPAASRPAVPAELRGRTEIPERVVTRIAACAAREVERVREVRERGPLAFGKHTHATVDGGLALLELEVSVDYPAPLLETAEEIRRHVGERVHTLTGLSVGQIDLDVTGVVPSPEEQGPPPQTPPEEG
ncbi:Asp23/Gls24 family envelope stress response protein [Streptosporangium saharense]|uniref:Asp23/Gls24 family envelope stress response protein n=1 Tax=Streptosporangium saharense TaxID=1706840 RepID=UPI0033263684